MKTYHQEYERRNQVEIKEKRDSLRRADRIAALEYYSTNNVPTCACCGETNLEFLCIDHIGGGGNEHRKSLTKNGAGAGSATTYRWLRMNNYPNGFQVLCHNCNLSIGFYGYCPHKIKS